VTWRLHLSAVFIVVQGGDRHVRPPVAAIRKRIVCVPAYFVYTAYLFYVLFADAGICCCRLCCLYCPCVPCVCTCFVLLPLTLCQPACTSSTPYRFAHCSVRIAASMRAAACVLFAVTALLRNRFYGCPTPPRHSYFSPAHPRQPWGRYHTETDGTLVCTAGWSEVTCGCSLVAGSSQRSEKGSGPHRP